MKEQAPFDAAKARLQYLEALDKQQLLSDEKKAELFFDGVVRGETKCVEMMRRYEVQLWAMTLASKGNRAALAAVRVSRRAIRNSQKARAYAEKLGIQLYGEESTDG